MDQVGTELAKYGVAGVAIALVGLFAFVINLFIRYMERVQQSHMKAYKELSAAIKSQAQATNKLDRTTDRNTEASTETLRFMKNLNGKLEDALIKKATIAQADIQHADFHETDKK